MKKMVALLAGAMLMMATSAMATYYTPTSTAIQSWTVQYNSTPGDVATNLGDDLNGGSDFQVNFRLPTHPATVIFGELFSSPTTFGGASEYLIKLANNNEHAWNFAAVVHTGTSWVNSPLTSILNQTSATLSFDLSAFTNYDGIGVMISDNAPLVLGNNAFDKVAEFNVAPVPEPGTMVLLGFGMLGLAIYGKRRLNKDA